MPPLKPLLAVTCILGVALLFAVAALRKKQGSEHVRWYNSTGTPPPGFEHYVRYARKHSCAQGPYNNIEGDLAPFRDPQFPEKRTITKKLIEEAKAYARGTDDIVLFRVHRGTAVAFWEDIVYPSWATDWGRILLDRLDELAPYLPDLEFLVNFHDFPKILLGNGESAEDIDARFDACTSASSQFQKFRQLHHTHGGHELNYSSRLLPIFSQTKVAGCHKDIQYPSLYNWNGILGEKDLKELLPWKDRIGKIVFRGATTGGHYHNKSSGKQYKESEFAKLHRFRLVKEFNNAPGMDFKFTDYLQCHNMCAELEKVYGKNATRMPQAELLGKYKYLMAVEGNSFLSRWPSYLSSGALSFRAGLYREWFDEAMLPFNISNVGGPGHYIPVEFDYSDLEAKLQWARDHDSDAERIAAAARKFAYTRLRNEDLICYLWRLLLEYGALLEH